MGVNSLWPLFGIANQLLATVAFCVATTIIIKMGKAKFAWVTLAPLLWLVSVTFTASFQKIFHPDPAIGFLAHAAKLGAEVPATAKRAADLPQLIFNDRLDAVVTGVLVSLVTLILLESAWLWVRVLSGTKPGEMRESPFVMTCLVEEEG